MNFGFKIFNWGKHIFANSFRHSGKTFDFDFETGDVEHFGRFSAESLFDVDAYSHDLILSDREIFAKIFPSSTRDIQGTLLGS